MTALPRLVVVLGPTGSGKSALGIRLAHELDGEVVVCDSTQVYRGFDIGTPDGLLGPRTRIAIRNFQASTGQIPDGFASTAVLERLRQP